MAKPRSGPVRPFRLATASLPRLGGRRTGIRWPHSCIQPARFLLLAAVAMLSGGCPPAPDRPRFDPVPVGRAIAIVNDNAEKVQATLRAVGSVDGRFTTEDGAHRSYHVQGVLFFHKPIFLRFDLKKLGSRQFLFGSNDQRFWVYSGGDDETFCGRHGVADDWPADLPMRPDQLVDAVGLGSVPTADHFGPPLQRVVEDYQQILFLAQRNDGGRYLGREYWVDRYAPRLLRRVIFRDEEGNVEMETQLDDYRVLGGSGALVPYEMVARWPKNEAHMRFRVRKWSVVPSVGTHDIQFSTPSACDP